MYVVFWGKEIGQKHPARGRHRGMFGATLTLSALTIAVGLLAAPIFSHLTRVSAQLLEITPYVDAVLGLSGSAGAPNQEMSR